jgi:hypothetical protein
MKIHHRETLVNDASKKLRDCLSSIESDLTYGEYLRVITSELCSVWQSIAKYTIRQERHPNDPDQPGGLE